MRNTKYEIRNEEWDLGFTNYDLRSDEEEEGKRNPEPEINPLPGGVAGETDSKDANFMSGRGGQEGEIGNRKLEIRFFNYQ